MATKGTFRWTCSTGPVGGDLIITGIEVNAPYAIFYSDANKALFFLKSMELHQHAFGAMHERIKPLMTLNDRRLTAL